MSEFETTVRLPPVRVLCYYQYKLIFHGFDAQTPVGDVVAAARSIPSVTNVILGDGFGYIYLNDWQVAHQLTLGGHSANGLTLTFMEALHCESNVKPMYTVKSPQKQDELQCWCEPIIPEQFVKELISDKSTPTKRRESFPNRPRSKLRRNSANPYLLPKGFVTPTKLGTVDQPAHTPAKRRFDDSGNLPEQFVRELAEERFVATMNQRNVQTPFKQPENSIKSATQSAPQSKVQGSSGSSSEVRENLPTSAKPLDGDRNPPPKRRFADQLQNLSPVIGRRDFRDIMQSTFIDDSHGPLQSRF